jgi:hypothetical protein
VEATAPNARVVVLVVGKSNRAKQSQYMSTKGGANNERNKGNLNKKPRKGAFLVLRLCNNV